MKAARILAVIVPVLGLGALWGLSHQTYHQGTDWEVPIEGYDPRDFLRGHYVEFAYDWPGIPARPTEQVQALCLEGDAPELARVTIIAPSAACAHPLRPAASGVYGHDALMRGRLYVGQDRAAALEGQLRNRDQRGIVTIRQREDGSFTPTAIRFRPLTPAEVAERDAMNAERLRPLSPPAIMSAQE